MHSDLSTPLSARRPRPSRIHAAASALGALLAGPFAFAGIIATDTDVPDVMSHGGTAGDPARYIIGLSGPVDHVSESDHTTIGDKTSYNELVIRNGSSYSGQEYSATIGMMGEHNTVIVSGAGSSWSFSAISVGWQASHNRLVIENGAQVSNSWSIDIGRGPAATYNSVLITGPGSLWQGQPIAMDGSHNSLTIENGGRLVSAYGHSWIGRVVGSSHNTVRVSGAGSAWINNGGLHLSETPNNTIMIEDGGLVTVQSDFGLRVDVDQGNAVRINGGFLAMSGNQVELLETMIANGAFQIWNGVDWVTGDAASFTYTYFSYYDAAAAELLTGHSGLGNFTILTAPYVAAIPEPATFAALAGLGALTLRGGRRGRRVR